MRTLCSFALLVGSCVLAAPAHATDHSCRNYGADVAVSIDDGVTSIDAGGSTTYTIVVTNDGHRTARDVDIDVAFTDAFGNVEWTVVGADGARCGEVCDRHPNHGRGHAWGRGRYHHDGSGTSSVGDIAVHGAVIPAGASCTFTAEATLTSTASGKVTVTANADDVARCAVDGEPATDTDTITPASGGGGPKDPPSQTPGDPKTGPSQTVGSDPTNPTASGTTSGDSSLDGSDTSSSDGSHGDHGGCSSTGTSGVSSLIALLSLLRGLRRPS